MSHKIENARTLASLIGIGEAEAATLLEVSAAITFDEHDSAAVFLANVICELLGRTISSVHKNAEQADAQVEIVVGAAQSVSRHYLRVHVAGDQTQIHAGATAAPLKEDLPRLLLVIIGCYATGRALRMLFRERLRVSGLPWDKPFVLEHNALLGDDQDWLAKRIDIGESVLAGAGAIGNGFLFALQHLDVAGRLFVVDSDSVSDGNLNRCVLFSRADIGKKKAQVLVERIAGTVPALSLEPKEMTLQALAKEHAEPAWLKRLIVGVDSRRVRRELQGEIPREVFDASTTGAEEVVFHHHMQPTDDACLACIYREDQQEAARERHIAEALGVGYEDVKEHHVSGRVAEQIAKRFGISSDAVVGQAYDTLFKAYCSEGKLLAAEGKQVLAPFAFVSVLAGCLLVVELARRVVGGESAQTFNYWRLNPWHTPVLTQRDTRPRHMECEFCREPVLLETARRLWPK